MIRLGKSQRAVLEYLRKHRTRWVSPTEIGREAGGGGRDATWASPICLRLVKRGYLWRNHKGHYKEKPRDVHQRRTEAAEKFIKSVRFLLKQHEGCSQLDTLGIATLLAAHDKEIRR